MTESSEHFFALIDANGNKRVPMKINRRDGGYGYAVHPIGKGNDASAAKYTENEQEMVQAVVLHGCGVRTKAVGGPHDGQTNTVSLGKRAIRSYWLCPTRMAWVAGSALRPINEGPVSER